jgi:hypothetical protein
LRVTTGSSLKGDVITDFRGVSVGGRDLIDLDGIPNVQFTTFFVSAINGWVVEFSANNGSGPIQAIEIRNYNALLVNADFII